MPKIDQEGFELAARMRKVRKELNLRQEDVAFDYKISHATYWRWERFAPPRSSPVRAWVRTVIKQLQARARVRRHDAKHYHRVRAAAAARKREYREKRRRQKLDSSVID